jgi:hypothetical protein
MGSFIANAEPCHCSAQTLKWTCLRNIEKFKARLAEERDPGQRATLAALLADEENKLAAGFPCNCRGPQADDRSNVTDFDRYQSMRGRVRASMPPWIEMSYARPQTLSGKKPPN